MCSPFGTKCLSSVSDLPQTSVHWVPIVLPSFSLRRCSQPKPFLLGSGGGVGGWGVGHAVESAWTQGRISVWYLPLLPKLGCHTGSLRKTSEDTWTIQWRLSVSSLPPFLRGYCPWFSGVFFIVPPILVSLFVGRVLKMLQQGYGTWWPCCCL